MNFIEKHADLLNHKSFDFAFIGIHSNIDNQLNGFV